MGAGLLFCWLYACGRGEGLVVVSVGRVVEGDASGVFWAYGVCEIRWEKI